MFKKHGKMIVLCAIMVVGLAMFNGGVYQTMNSSKIVETSSAFFLHNSFHIEGLRMAVFCIAVCMVGFATFVAGLIGIVIRLAKN